MQFRSNITKRDMRRKHKDGRETVLSRYVLQYRDPATGGRKQKFFETRKEAEAEDHLLHVLVEEGGLLSPKKTPTVAEAVQHWLGHCESRVSPFTLMAYRQVAEAYIVGPALVGTKEDRRRHSLTGKIPEGVGRIPMMGNYKISDLTTAQIREWHQAVLKISSPYVARQAKKYLSTVLSMTGEDFGIRVPLMPKRVASGYQKKERALLRQDQIKTVLDAARQDKRHGVYYAFPFLTGARPGEMLGLLWEDVDFIDNVIHIRRNQDPKGNIKPFPKTAAGQRTIPMVPILRDMLMEWRPRCPQRTGFPQRVFPGLGFQTKDPERQIKAGGPLIIQMVNPHSGVRV